MTTDRSLLVAQQRNPDTAADPTDDAPTAARTAAGQSAWHVRRGPQRRSSESTTALLRHPRVGISPWAGWYFALCFFGTRLGQSQDVLGRRFRRSVADVRLSS
jgi:hypothetical protein